VLLLLAGAAYAMRAPISSLLSSVIPQAGARAVAGADSSDTVVKTRDLQLAPLAGDSVVITLGDTAFDEGVITLQTPPSQPAPETVRVVQRAPAPVKPAPVARAPVEPAEEEPVPEEPVAEEPAAEEPAPAEPTVQAPAPPLVADPAPAPAVAPAPPPSAAARITKGSVLSLRAAEKICTDKKKEGDQFQAAVEQDVQGDGAVIPKGTVVTFAIERLKRAASDQPLEFTVAPKSIALNGTSVPLAATVDTFAFKRKGRGLLGALAGAAVGAAATGAATGKTKGAVVGGVVGGATGAVVGSNLKTGDGCIDKKALMRITLTADLTPR
jgi:outer membrane biosynthesis protein TonB